MIVQYGNNLKSLKEEWFCDFSMPRILTVVQPSEIMLTKFFKTSTGVSLKMWKIQNSELDLHG